MLQQNLPIRTPEGARIREAFSAGREQIIDIPLLWPKKIPLAEVVQMLREMSDAEYVHPEGLIPKMAVAYVLNLGELRLLDAPYIQTRYYNKDALEAVIARVKAQIKDETK